VLLDVDGTLIDSNDAHAHAWVDVLVDAGYDVTFARVRLLIGMGGDKILPMLTGLDPDSHAGAQILERRFSRFRDRYLPGIRAFPQVRDLIRRMHGAGLTTVVATSATGEELQALLRIGGVDDLLPQAVTSSDASSSKPDPDIVHAALRRVKASAEEAVMIGDTPYDIEAAHRLGVPAIALRCGGWSDHQLGAAEQRFDDPAHLLASYEQSMLHTRRRA
jgi:phosphoglycolate phosphatase-like HAD superfamily hydrolase